MSYSYTIPTSDELYSTARVEGVDASYKDLSQVCGRIRGKPLAWALDFLQKASEGDIPVFFARHNKRLGHRKELGGRKGRYPKKAAFFVLKVLRSAQSNGRVKGLSDDMQIVHVSANKKYTFPRMASKGRRARANYELARIEVVLKSSGRSVEKKVEVRPPAEKKAVSPAETKATQPAAPIVAPDAVIEKPSASAANSSSPILPRNQKSQVKS